jgi:hypothetical protein
MKSLVSPACLKKSRYAANAQHSQDNLWWSVQDECEGISGRNDASKDDREERINRTLAKEVFCSRKWRAKADRARKKRRRNARRQRI